MVRLLPPSYNPRFRIADRAADRQRHPFVAHQGELDRAVQIDLACLKIVGEEDIPLQGTAELLPGECELRDLQRPVPEAMPPSNGVFQKPSMP